MGRKRLVFCAFCLGAGVSLPLNGLLCGVGVYAVQFGESSFLALTRALYLTGFPVAVTQLLLSDSQSRQCQTKTKLWCDARRVIGAYALGGASLLVGGPKVASETELVLLGCIVGITTVVSQGYAFQMVLSCAKPRDGTVAALSLGYQASSIICFAAQHAAHFMPPASDSSKWIYFSTLAVFTWCCIGAVFAFVLCYQPSTSSSCAVAHPTENQQSSSEEPLLSEATSQASIYRSTDNNVDQEAGNGEQQPQLGGAGELENQAEFGWYKAFSAAWLPASGLFITIFASMVIFPFYSYVPSENKGEHASAELATKLVYVKMFSDALARPLTVWIPFKVAKVQLMVLSLLRLALFVPAFFLYVFTNTFGGQNDLLFCIAVGIFSASSGFFKTSAYQLVKTLGVQQIYVRRVNDAMNLAFQFAFVASLTVGSILLMVLV